MADQSNSSTNMSPNSEKSCPQRSALKMKSLLLFSNHNELIVNSSMEGSPIVQSRYQIYWEDKEIVVILTNKSTVESAIRQALEQYSLPVQNTHNYSLYMAKKNGAPKTDFPSFQMNQLMTKTGTNRFTMTEELKSNYSSPLMVRKSISKEMVVKKKKGNWLLNLIGCGCSDE